MTFNVLTVCTVNVCRSPLVAAVLTQRLGALAGGVRVSSCGLRSIDGQAMCPEMVRLAVTDEHAPILHPALKSHRSRQVTTELIQQSDLILVADRQVRSGIVKLQPRAAERTFTLREAALLSNQVSVDVEGDTVADRLRALTMALNQNRGFTELPRVERIPRLAPPWRWPRVHAHDIPDAHRAELVPHRLVHGLALRAAEQVATRLGASTAGCRT